MVFQTSFKGMCNRYEEKFVKCEVLSSKEDAAILSILIVDTLWSKYSYSAIETQNTAAVNSEIGTCTKI